MNVGEGMTKTLRTVCWIASAYFFGIANLAYSYPPDLSGSAGIALLIGIALFLLPFAKSLSITGLFSYEARIKEVKRDVSEFKAETRDLLKIQNSLITNVSNNQSTHNVFNIPSLTDAANAERQLGKTVRDVPSPAVSARVERATAVGPTELNLELARTRMELEQELRKKLGRSTNLGGKRDTKFLSLTGLWREYLRENEHLANLDSAMRYVVDISNAAIHGQNVPIEHAVEAIQMGEDIKVALANG
ncbi:hypothetical protein [Hoeflea sp. TYP-13]|uniref:hypothetical protein n=1 Tax=Hoeflea sp. TYP-13 TaxID=3230023 RepID=UPI0034C65ED4